MQIQFDPLIAFAQSHPAEMTTGMMTMALVTAAMQRTSVLKNSPLARSVLSGTLGLTAGTSVIIAATQSDLAGKLLLTASAVASIGFGYLYMANRTVSAATETAIPKHSLLSPSVFASIVGATTAESRACLEARKDTFTRLNRDFVAKRDTMNVADFVAWWKLQFDGLSEDQQRLIIFEDMKEWVRAKCQSIGTPPSDDLVAQSTHGLYSDIMTRKKSLAFVRDLEIAINETSEWNPMDDAFVPRYLIQIIGLLESQIALTQVGAPMQAVLPLTNAASASASADEPLSFQELTFFGLIQAISGHAAADGLFRVPGGVQNVDALFDKLFPSAPTKKPKGSAYKRAKTFLSFGGKNAQASPPASLSQADMKELLKGQDANDLVGLFKKMLKECPEFQYFLSDVQDDLIGAFSAAEEPTTEAIRDVVMDEKFPAAKRGQLKAIIQMLTVVAEKNAQMNAANLSTCMAPNFFPSRGDPLSDAAQTPVQNAAVAFMIEQCKEIFGTDQDVKLA